MNNKPQYRKRGMMSEETIEKALEWVSKLPKQQVLHLHNFGEPLLHKDFDKIAMRFKEITHVSFSTNGILLDEEWADKLAKVGFAWITVSPWDIKAADRAMQLLRERNVMTVGQVGWLHNFAGTAKGTNQGQMTGCPFLSNGTAVIRWNGDLTSCCITDREQDVIGNIFDSQIPEMKAYDICASCHHKV